MPELPPRQEGARLVLGWPWGGRNLPRKVVKRNEIYRTNVKKKKYL